MGSKQDSRKHAGAYSYLTPLKLGSQNDNYVQVWRRSIGYTLAKVEVGKDRKAVLELTFRRSVLHKDTLHTTRTHARTHARTHTHTHTLTHTALENEQAGPGFVIPESKTRMPA